MRDNFRFQTTINNCAFSGFVFSIFGWALLHAWGFQVRAGAAMHVVTALFGLGLAAITFRRYRLYWERPQSKEGFNISNAGWCLLLLAIGNVLGQLVLAGWVLPLAIFSIGLNFVPWSKVPLCRRHFFASCTLIGVAIAGTLLVAGNASAGPMKFPIASWVFWGSACVALLRKY
jgi:hypothetical protein